MMAMGINSLFKISGPAVPSTMEVATPQGIDAKQLAETYVQYGKRLCGKVTGSTAAFGSMLLKIYNAEKQRQIGDEQLQAQRKVEIQNKIAEAESNIVKEKERMAHIEGVVRSYEETKTALDEQYIEAKHQHGEVNKMARVKMFIGLLILIPLTVYLYSFYVDIILEALGGTMNRYTAYFAPVIFFGLGFALHFFAVQENRTKYLKIAAVFAATFIFDAILAYLIAEATYVAWVNNQLSNQPPYSIPMAIEDPKVWAILFSGFVAYIIWGIVFDMTMTAYENVRSNKKGMEQVQHKIEDVKKKILENKEEALQIKGKITDWETRKQALMRSLSENVHIDLQIIHTALSDFQAGWISLMPALGLTSQQLDETKAIYDETIKSMFK